MADKSFGVKELNLLNASGTPTVTSPNNLNLNANTVAISTSCTIGNNLTVTSTTNSANLNVTGIGTITRAFATDLFVSGISTITRMVVADNVTGIGTITRAFATDLSVSGVTTITVPANSNPHSSWDVVNNSASAYRFTGPGQDGAEDNPDIYLIRGQRYVFKMNASGHPFQIRVSNGGSAYSDGVTNNGSQTGNVVFNVQHDAPAQLVYQCTSHGGMVGNIYIVGQHLANGANNRLLTATSAYGMNGESDLTFDGTTFKILNTVPKIELNDGSSRILQVRGGSTSHNPSIITQYASQVYIGANNVESVGIGSEHLTITNGDLVIGTAGHGIDFHNYGSGTNISSNLLDDYEEGSAVPDFANADNSIVTVDRYTYTKVGRLVHFEAKFTVGSNNDGSGFGFTLPVGQAGSRETVFSAISTRSGSTTTPFAFVVNANQSYAYAKALDGFSSTNCEYVDFAGDIILVSGTYEST